MKVASIITMIVLCAFACLLSAKPVKTRRVNEAVLFSLVKANATATKKYNLQNEKWSIPQWNASKYVEVTVGRIGRIYDWQGKLIKVHSSPFRNAGVMGNYAEVGWELLNQDKKQFSDMFGLYLVRFDGKKWHEIASADAADGYSDQLKKAKVPAWVVKRLRF